MSPALVETKFFVPQVRAGSMARRLDDQFGLGRRVTLVSNWRRRPWRERSTRLGSILWRSCAQRVMTSWPRTLPASSRRTASGTSAKV
jgi:hypothetical protein